MRESGFQKKMIDEIQAAFPEAIILMNDASYLLGVPDITVLYRSRWAFLECKKEEHSRKQPLQDDYVDYAATWSFGAFVHQDNWPLIRPMLFDFLIGDE